MNWLRKILFIYDRHILAKVIPLPFALHTSTAICNMVRLIANKYLENDKVSLDSKQNVKSNIFRAVTIT
jgi:hypothetical protein